MTSRSVIFLSAVSRELKSARQLVANTLTFLGYEPDWEDIFGAEQGDLLGILRERIDASAGVVQIVGHCYGAEPSAPDENFGRVSYTQYEALYARQRGKKVWYLFLDDRFPADPCDPEPEEIAQFQRVYRERIQAGGDLYHPLMSSESLEASVLKLRNDLTRLRRGVKQWAALVLGLLVVLCSGLVWMKFGQQRQGKQLDQLTQQNEKFLQAIHDLPQTLAQVPHAGPNESEQVRLDRAYDALENKLHLPGGTLAKELPKFAERLLARADTSALDRANAYFATSKFAEAEVSALQAKDKALADAGQPVHDAIGALEVAGWSAQNQMQPDRALDHFRAAAALSSREREPAEWVRLQNAIGGIFVSTGNFRDAGPIFYDAAATSKRALSADAPLTLFSRNCLALVLAYEGKFVEAENEYRGVIQGFDHALGAEHPTTLGCRSVYATFLSDQGRRLEAETELREVLAIQERVLGTDHLDTVNSRFCLGIVLKEQGMSSEAEKELRAVLATRQRVQGGEHVDTLWTRSLLAGLLADCGKADEAETEVRLALEIMSRVLKPDHLKILVARTALIVALRAQGKSAEAEKESRTVIEIEERNFGRESPMALSGRLELAHILVSQGRHADAETELKKLLDIQNRLHGSEHRDSFSTRNSLAWILVLQKKYADAESEIRPAIQGMNAVLGPEDGLTLAARDTLAEALRGQGKLDEAEKQHREILAVTERVLGPETPLLPATCHHLALTLEAEMKLPEALTFARRAESGRMKHSGLEHPDTKEAKALRERLEAALKAK